MTTQNGISPQEREVAFGLEVEGFLSSSIGRYLIQRAEESVEAAVEELKRADPEKPAGIRALQHQISIAENFQYWLAEAVQAGLNAQLELLDQ